jgi:hypothetical protein
MNKSFFERNAKLFSGLLLVLFLLEFNHARNQGQEIAQLNDSLSSAVTQIDELSEQVKDLESANKGLLTEISTLQAENERLKAAERLSALKSLGLGNSNIGSSGATGRCNDGTETFAVNRQGACSWHGGVDYWY